MVDHVHGGDLLRREIDCVAVARAAQDLGRQGYAVFVLEQVRDGDPAKASAELKERVRRLLLARRGADYYGFYRIGLRNRADVTIYPDQL
jgi:hypothetical protein